MNLCIAGPRYNRFEIETNLARKTFYLQVGRKALYAEVGPPFTNPPSANDKWAEVRRTTGCTLLFLGRLSVTLSTMAKPRPLSELI